MLLDSEQAGYLGKLEIGWAIAKLQGRWFKPFSVRFPLVTLDKGSVTDDTIRKHMESMGYGRKTATTSQDGFSGVISPQEGFSASPRASGAGIPAIPVSAKKGRQEKRCAINLTTKESEFLKDVLQHSTSSITDRYRRLGLSPRIGNNVQRFFLDKSLISSQSISTPKGCIKILCLTRKGREVLGYDSAPSTRHGGIEHQYWKEKVATHLRGLGYTIQEECPIGEGKTVDLVARSDGKRIAVEIETGKSDAVANIRKCLQAGFDSILSVATTPRLKNALEAQANLLGKAQDTVRVTTGAEFLDRGDLLL